MEAGINGQMQGDIGWPPRNGPIRLDQIPSSQYWEMGQKKPSTVNQDLLQGFISSQFNLDAEPGPVSHFLYF
jgi:hypothetical protein